jgi:hypothetical protein
MALEDTCVDILEDDFEHDQDINWSKLHKVHIGHDVQGQMRRIARIVKDTGANCLVLLVL